VSEAGLLSPRRRGYRPLYPAADAQLVSNAHSTASSRVATTRRHAPAATYGDLWACGLCVHASAICTDALKRLPCSDGISLRAMNLPDQQDGVTDSAQAAAYVQQLK
jgi:hypothetical protein